MVSAKSDPSKYRALCISICLGKLFRSILNQRLNTHLKSRDIPRWETYSFPKLKQKLVIFENCCVKIWYYNWWILMITMLTINYVHLIVLWNEKQIDLTLIGMLDTCYDLYWCCYCNYHAFEAFALLYCYSYANQAHSIGSPIDWLLPMKVSEIYFKLPSYFYRGTWLTSCNSVTKF